MNIATLKHIAGHLCKSSIQANLKTKPPLNFGSGIALLITFLLAPCSTPAAPDNDLFANAISISGTNITVTGSNTGAGKEPGEPYHAGYAGGASVWWSWTAPFSGTATMNTSGSTFDTLLAVYTGNSVSELREIACNDDDMNASDVRTSSLFFDTIANQTYQIAVDGWEAESGAITLSVQLGPFTPAPQAPGWALLDPYGQMVYSTNFGGKVVILDFWATWCGPCRNGLPDLVALQEKYRGDGLAVVGADISWTEDAATVAIFLATWTPTINYQIVMADLAMADAFGGISSIPTTFIIDRQNIIRNKFVGTQSGSTLERMIYTPLYRNSSSLGYSRSGSQMVLTWRTNAQPFTLQYATNLVAPVWTAWPNAPAVVNGTNTIEIPSTGTPGYFRLKMTY